MAQDRVALVTGAGSGIGRATVRKLLAGGARVVATDRDAAGLAETATLAAAGDRLRTLVQDVTDESAPADAVGAAVAGFGGLDWLVNNAGIGRSTTVSDTADADWDRFMQTNLRSVFRFSRQALGVMQPGRAAIVHLASVFGLVGYPGSAGYSAAKAAIVGLTHQMAADYGPKGIRVNAVAPGLIETGMTRERLHGDARYRKLMLETTPFTRWGQPEDIANAIAFLLSDEAAFVNGHVLAVDGGWSVTNYVKSAFD
ncbi:MAG: SDR family NAD(P)-dependent oxidoreductase [Reyranellaceae bacterium]